MYKIKNFINYNLAQSLIFLLVIFISLFLSGCSFKGIDPQYYEFKKLCENVDNEVTIYNKDYWEMYKDYVENRFKDSKVDSENKEYYYHKKLDKRIYPYDMKNILKTEQKKGNITILIYDKYYKDIHYATYTRYNYKEKGLWLRGDEGAGWHLETEDDLTCSYLDNFYKALGR
ncbi:hypothetical protein [Helicobacter sp. MIT 14-3879]|uniref:hypothetical protein n=1 Tax=Helicobacter sp. MIT 14-3879 TaxID=2040649 RepID=UPI0015F137D3|nr:hypothetical protein [Helicobacter sp. MIT 14-3879]